MNSIVGLKDKSARPFSNTYLSSAGDWGMGRVKSPGVGKITETYLAYGLIGTLKYEGILHLIKEVGGEEEGNNTMEGA
ncbi:hypothetical protein L1887_32214 [Cichorium endivia]|nr:hypothetical protein L1887_32214 [Cichorium endivia]